MSEIQNQIEKLKTIQESMDVLTDSLVANPVAKESTMIAESQSIKEKIDNIKLPEIDTTELAKESTLQGVKDLVENIKQNVDLVPVTNLLQQIVDANVLRPNLQGITFVDGTATDDISALIVGGAPNILTIGSETFNDVIRQYTFSGCSSLQQANFPLATSIGNYAFNSCSNLKQVNIPLATSVSGFTFYSCSSLQQANIPLVASVGVNDFQGCNNLIKLTLGVNLGKSINLSSANWNPTNAYSTASRSLIPEDVQAEHPLWYNLDYLLYNIRECIAANLPDRTGQSALTITFNATMKGHINNSPETIAAFTDKNWTIA